MEEENKSLKKSLIYLKDGKKILLDDTILNRMKAKLRGFKFISAVDWNKMLGVKNNDR